MKPVDFRNATFSELESRIAGMREAVLGAWRRQGPGTTAEIAEKSGLSILTLRPRTTELFELGFIMLTPEQPSKGEGCYRARTTSEHLGWLNAAQAEARNPQRQLNLG
jgi:hypothetical protein